MPVAMSQSTKNRQYKDLLMPLRAAPYMSFLLLDILTSMYYNVFCSPPVTRPDPLKLKIKYKPIRQSSLTSSSDIIFATHIHLLVSDIIVAALGAESVTWFKRAP